MPKVSVIIPFNNVENYFEECLKSVSNQTLKDIEIILINDASIDGSRSIAQKYTEKDSRFKIIDIKEQKGQGYARNRGIEVAIGDYIGFVDSDDFIEQNMFEELYNSAVKADTDITMCQVREYDDVIGKYANSDYYSLSILSKFKDRIFSAKDTKEEMLDINVALWNKIYKRQYLLSTGEKFPEGFIYEDLPFFFGTYLKANKINIVWKVLYNYRVNRKNSTMRQFNNKILDRIPMVSLTFEKMKQIPYLKDMEQKIQGWIINDLFHRYILLKENYHKEFFFLMKKVFENLEIKDINSPFWKTIYHFQGYRLVINNKFEDFNQKVFQEYLDIHEVENRIRTEISNIGAFLYEQSKSSNDDIKSCIKRFETIKDEYSKLQFNKDFSQINYKEYYSSLYGDIKDLSYVIHYYFEELKNEQNQIKEQIKFLTDEINNLKRGL